MKLDKQKTFAGKRFDQFAYSGKEGVPQSMCTIINCSKVNSSLLLSKDSLPSKHLRSSKLLQFVKTQAPKPWEKSLYILDLYILETTTICWQGESLRKVLKQLRFLCTALSTTGCCSCLQTASSTMEDLGQQQELSAKIKTWGRGGSTDFILWEQNASQIWHKKFCPPPWFSPWIFHHHLYFPMDQQQQCARNALIAWFQKSAAFQEAQAHSLLSTHSSRCERSVRLQFRSHKKHKCNPNLPCWQSLLTYLIHRNDDM